MKLKHLGYDSKELTCAECANFLEQYWHNQKNPQKVVVSTPANTNVLPNPTHQQMVMPQQQQPYGGYPQQPNVNQVPYYPPNNASVLPNPAQQPLSAPQPHYDAQYTPQQQYPAQPQYNPGSQASQYNSGQQPQQYNQAYPPQYDNSAQQQQFNQPPQQPYDQSQSSQAKIFYPSQYSAHAAVQQQVAQPQPTTQFTQLYNNNQPTYDPSRPQQFSAHGAPPSNNQAQSQSNYAQTPTIIPPHNNNSTRNNYGQESSYPQLQPMEGHGMPPSGHVTPYVDSNPYQN